MARFEKKQSADIQTFFLRADS